VSVVHQLGHMQICTLTQTHNYASIPPHNCFTGQMPFLLPNQQCQSTEGNWDKRKFITTVLYSIHHAKCDVYTYETLTVENHCIFSFLFLSCFNESLFVYMRCVIVYEFLVIMSLIFNSSAIDVVLVSDSQFPSARL